MHEYSLARALLRDVAVHAAASPGGSVRAITVSIGEFSGIEAELLRSAFEELREQTCASAAELRINCVDLIAVCCRCGLEFPVESFRFVCPDCAHHEVQVVRGDELRLESLTMQDTETESCHPR